jgi:hypothetical protein
VKDYETESSIESLYYHLHTEWNDSGEQTCGGTDTYGHYDPSKKCGPASSWRNVPGVCVDEIVYSCDDSSEEAMASSCEVGDLSGKMGKLYNVRNRFLATVVDPVPPIRDDFGRSTDGSKYASIVFHDGTSGARLFCAKLRKIE